MTDARDAMQAAVLVSEVSAEFPLVLFWNQFTSPLLVYPRA